MRKIVYIAIGVRFSRKNYNLWCEKRFSFACKIVHTRIHTERRVASSSQQRHHQQYEALEKIFGKFEQSVVNIGEKCDNLQKSARSCENLGFSKLEVNFSLVKLCLAKVIERSVVGQDGDGSGSQSASSFCRSGTG